MSAAHFQLRSSGGDRDGQIIAIALPPNYPHMKLNEYVKGGYVPPIRRTSLYQPSDWVFWERGLEMTDWKPALLIEWL